MQTQAKRQIIVLGGGYAGLLAAARAAQAGDGVEVTLINGANAFVQRIRLHELLAGGQPRTAPLAPLLRRRGIRFVQGYVDHIDPARERVMGRTFAANTFERGYDELVVALGSRTATSVPGVAAHTLQLDNPATAHAAAGRLHELASRNGRVLVVGGGLSAIETASELAERLPSLSVSLATSGRLGAAFAQAGATHVYARLKHLKVGLHEDTAISAVEPGRAFTAGRDTIDFDMCVWCGGFEASPIGRAAGLAVDRSGRIVVDATLRVATVPNIFAVGDAAAVTTVSGTIRMGCASAMPMGAHVGNNLRRLLRGEPLAPFAMDFKGRCISLGRTDGLFQWTEPNDRSRPAVWAGRRAVLLKEAICGMTYMSVVGELRWGLPLYRWPGARRVTDVHAETMGHRSA